eukprot:ctg_4957.g643
MAPAHPCVSDSASVTLLRQRSASGRAGYPLVRTPILCRSTLVAVTQRAFSLPQWLQRLELPPANWRALLLHALSTLLGDLADALGSSTLSPLWLALPRTRNSLPWSADDARPMRAAWVSACGTVPARRLVSFLSSWRAKNGLSSSTRMQAVREKSKRFWDARAGAALPAYYEGFVGRTGVMEAAQAVGDAHQVQVRLAPSGGGESMVFLHESSSVMGALLEMRQRNTSYVLVAGDPIEAYRRARATAAAGE